MEAQITVGNLMQLAAFIFAAGMIVQSIKGVGDRVERLTTRLEGLESKMEEGNKAIHDVLNQHRERIATVEALWHGRRSLDP